MSCALDPDHSVEKRELTNTLIEQSEFIQYGYNNKKVTKIASGEWTDAVVGWVANIAMVKTGNSATTVKKKRTVERSFTDIHFQGSNQGDDYWSNSFNLNSPELRVKCVGDQDRTFPIQAWKSNIEQGTYRYIPDNGSYRTLKFLYDERREWYTIRKKHPEKVATAWHQNCKRLQREMRRQLKKDLGKAERDKQQVASARTVSTRNSIEPFSGSEISRSNSFIQSRGETQSEQSTPIKEHNDTVTKASAIEELKGKNSDHSDSSKQLGRKETRIRSTHSDGAVSQIRKMKTIHEREHESLTPNTTPHYSIPSSKSLTPNTTPHYSIPSSNHMLKSASDLFIENFSSRISALEDEIKKDAKWLRKNDSEFKVGSNRPKYRESTRPNLKDTGSNSSTPRQAFKTETLGCEVFSVKPMAQKDLKPVTDKSKSNSRHSNHSQEGRPGPRKGSLVPNAHSHANDPMVNYAPELDHGHGSMRTPENGKPLMLNTLTGTKINTYSSKRSNSFKSPATITLCNSSPSPSGSQQSKHLEPYQQIVIEKKSDKKESIQSIPTIQNITALLPEISGKRMEVASAAHRLL